MHICTSCCPPKREVEQESRGTDELSNNIKTVNKQIEEDSQTRFYCCGRVPPEGPYKKRHGMTDGRVLPNDNSIELAVEASEENTLPKDLKLPYVEKIPEELYQGRTLEVYGRLLENANRFSINLCTGKEKISDIAFHFNPRVERRVVIRNHRIRGKWGVEEITSLLPFPFKLQRNFSVLIFIADEQFLVAVNKRHHCAFAFRIPIEKIKYLIILGDISLSYVEHSDKIFYPPKIFKKTPIIIVPQLINPKESKCSFKRKCSVIKLGSKIDIFGRVKILPRAFFVNLQKGSTLWPHPVIPFHMNLRMHTGDSHRNEKEIIFNSWFDGFWGTEEIITSCPFLPGTPFHITIICENDGFNVSVDDCSYHKYMKNFNTDIDSVVIHGDVIVNKVTIR